MVQIVQELKAVGRKLRRPKHTFQLRTRPFQIQPFMLAPVLPGETLKNLLMQARVVSDPVKNPLLGAHTEYYFFYVKHRDLSIRDQLTMMALDPQYSTTALNGAAAVKTYHAANSIDWAQRCLERVVETYFRDEGEAWNAGGLLDGLPMAHALGADESFWESLINASAIPDPVDGNTAEFGEERAREFFEYAREMKFTAMSYEEWLGTFGVNVPQKPNKPELVRYLKDWTYPTNTVNPADGKPSSAYSWSVQERADKDRFFKEPGFLFGVTVMRPKFYLSKQVCNGSDMLTSAQYWLPALLADAPEMSLRFYAQGAGPLPTWGDAANPYWLDVRDLYLYGDQFLNFALTETDAGLVALPTPTGSTKYLAATDIDGFFKAAAPANQIRQDGVCTLNILGAQIDQT